MNLDAFWALIDEQITRLKTAKTVDEVMRICPRGSGYHPDYGFFGGSGGDDSVLDSLRDAGWTIAWMEAHYFYALRSPDGTEYLTYIEGDLQRGNNKPLGHGEPDPEPEPEPEPELIATLTAEQVGDGAMACCRSTIGPPCQHRTVKE